MEKTVFVSCPMDCWDLCRFVVTVDNNQIKNLEGDPNHPVTGGVVCRKGRALVKRFYHPDRIVHPMMKKNGKFVRISYGQAFDIIADKLFSIKNQFGTKAVLNYTSGGYGGLKKQIQDIFFNYFGGVTKPEGSLCWGAGIAAQKYDFGNAKGHFPDDVLNSNTILLWGRNPKETSIHLYTLLKQAQKNGSRIIVIDPVKTSTARAFDNYIRINPSTDAALALAMANVIIEKKRHDTNFIEKHVSGFKRFKEYASGFTLQRAEKITGISAETVKSTALLYAESKTASIYIGLGMQRYHNGGNAVRSIDALGAITGKIGKKGCGVNYAAVSLSPYLNDLYKKSVTIAENRRFFTIGRLGQFLEQVSDPPIKAIFVGYANPLTQSPDLEKTIKNFSKIDFKVVFDHFMTDTARHADIVLPAAFVFEQEDLFATSMYSPILNYSQKALDPAQGIIPEFEFYMKLAEKMGLKSFGFKDSRDYLQKSVQPLLEKQGKSFSQLSESYLKIDTDEISWDNKVFETPSARIELYSEKALQDGCSPLPSFVEPCTGDEKFPLRLLTCHTKDSMHSQGFAFNDAIPKVYLNQKMVQKLSLEKKSHVIVKGQASKIKAELCIDKAVGDNTAFMYQGFWQKNGAVNYLTTSGLSDMGQQAAYYDSFCTIEKIE